jgi:hypothetical protein
MNWLSLLATVTKALESIEPLPNADTDGLSEAIAGLTALVPAEMKGRLMTVPTGFVQILQSDLDTFTSEIASAVGVLGPYIQQLLANQAIPLPAADEANITAAITALQNIEPPAPTPPGS